MDDSQLSIPAKDGPIPHQAVVLPHPGAPKTQSEEPIDLKPPPPSYESQYGGQPEQNGAPAEVNTNKPMEQFDVDLENQDRGSNVVPPRRTTQPKSCCCFTW